MGNISLTAQDGLASYEGDINVTLGADSQLSTKQWTRLSFSDQATYNLFLSKYAPHIMGKYDRLLMLSTEINAEVWNFLTTHKSSIDQIDVTDTQVTAESFLGSVDFQVNQINRIRDTYEHLQGDGEHIYLKERNPQPGDIDLIDRIILGSASDGESDSHASDMATIMLGNGNTDVTSLGLAPLALLPTTSFRNLFPDEDMPIDGYPLHIQNNSYGIDIENYYGLEAVAYDDATFQRPEFFPIFSSGNQGQAISPEGLYEGIEGASNLTGNFKQAKNVIVVGAIDNNKIVLPLSSRGPAYDGRIKPDLVAFGEEGSSNAAALVSGSALLIRQALLERGEQATQPLIKSVLITGAEDLGDIGPDHLYGYGNVSLFNTLSLVDDGQYTSGNIEPDSDTIFNVVVPDGVEELKVTLCWLDTPGEEGSSTVLNEDLDLFMTFENNEFLPLQVTYSNDNGTLLRTVISGVDNKNTVEQVYLENPGSGTYNIQVRSLNANVTVPYAVSYAYKMKDDFTWGYPVRNDILVAGETNRIVWESTYQEKIAIQYKMDNVWNDLINGETENYDWDIPIDMVGSIEFRALIEKDTFYSEEVLISERPSLDVVALCDDFTAIRVEQVSLADSFQYYLLETDGFTKVGTTTDPEFIYDDGSISGADFLYVLPFYTGKPGLRSTAINVENLSPSCVLSFFAVIAEVDRVDLIVELEAEEIVEQISFYRVTETGETLIAEVNSSISNLVTVADDTPKVGLNRYKALVTLETGQVIESTIREVFYVGEDNFLVLPTLLSAEEDFLTVFNNDITRPTITIYNQVGKIVLTKKLVLGVDLLDLADTQDGIYYYFIRNDDGDVLSQGSIIAL